MTEMWTVALMFRGGRQLNLRFNGEASAQKAFAAFRETGASVYVVDHYGSTVELRDVAVLEAVLLEDMEKAQEAGIEMALIQARGQAKANTRAQSDPQLRFVSNAGGMPLSGLRS